MIHFKRRRRKEERAEEEGRNCKRGKGRKGDNGRMKRTRQGRGASKRALGERGVLSIYLKLE